MTESQPKKINAENGGEAAENAALPVRLTLRKAERLNNHNLVDKLFADGCSVYAYPLRMFHILLTEEEVKKMSHGIIPPNTDRLQMMITVPKKKFKHAVDRVWLRRRIREAYRLHRTELKNAVLADERGRYMLLAFIYASDKKREYASIENKMSKLLTKALDTLTDKEPETNASPKDE